MYTLSLNGTWNLYCCIPDILNAPRECCLKAIVPGDVHLDLLKAGLISEPLIGKNSQNINWIEEKDWWYYREFELTKEALCERIDLVFEGIDLTSDIYLNDRKIGHTNNMFREYRFNVTDFLHEGWNSIKVRVDVGLRAAEGKPTNDFEICWSTWDVRRMWIRKATQAFYWDIAPRLLTCGIWKGVRLESFDSGTIRDVYVESKVEHENAYVTIHVELENFVHYQGYSLTAVIRDDSVCEVATADISADKLGCVEEILKLEIPAVKLWWPRYMGDQHLYSVEIYLLNDRGMEIANRKLRHGVRSISIEQKDINNEESTFNFLVNGKRLFCKGWDWVPPDAIYARITPETEKKLLDLAANCHTNMIRVWGGGIYPDTALYDYCDELGILVWQDFMLACGYYPDFDEEFCKEFEEEAKCVIRKFRNHASLGLWCANNENQQVHDTVNPRGVHLGQKLYDDLLPKLISRLDPNNLYWPGSPFGGPTANSCKRGDQHIWDYSMAWLTNGSRQLKIWDFAEENPKFVSEFGIEAPPNQLTARDFMEGRIVDRTSDEWYHHMCYFCVGLLENLMLKYYKNDPVEDATEFTMAGQLIQAEAVKDIVETLRARMYVCGGVLYWQFAESWGHTGYSPVDYYLRLKASYYYFKRAFAPVTVVFAEHGYEVYVLNDTLKTKHVQVEYGIKTFDGEQICCYEKNIILNPNSVVSVGSVEINQTINTRTAFAYSVLRMNGRIIAVNRRFLAPLKELQLPKMNIVKQIQLVSPGFWQMTLSSLTFQWDVNLEEDDQFEYSDNAFDLWPGEIKKVYITAKEPCSICNPSVYSINYYRGEDKSENKVDF